MRQFTASSQLPERSRHANHKRVLRVRTSGHFAGKRIRTEIERCKQCGGLLLSVEQTTVTRGQS